MNRRSVLIALLAAVMTATFARADDDDHEHARRALERGDVLPLARILDIVGGRLGGQLVDVEFDEKDGRYIYELKVMSPGGKLSEIEVDAATAEILKREDD
ncbi:PepSY domain-containing protein [Rhizobiaceae sp. 2RAB30]